jgi:hypothetical protein
MAYMRVERRTWIISVLSELRLDILRSNSNRSASLPPSSRYHYFLFKQFKAYLPRISLISGALSMAMGFVPQTICLWWEQECGM